MSHSATAKILLRMLYFDIILHSNFSPQLKEDNTDFVWYRFSQNLVLLLFKCEVHAETVGIIHFCSGFFAAHIKFCLFALISIVKVFVDINLLMAQGFNKHS